jgi:hypothetical protein
MDDRGSLFDRGLPRRTKFINPRYGVSTATLYNFFHLVWFFIRAS